MQTLKFSSFLEDNLHDKSRKEECFDLRRTVLSSTVVKLVLPLSRRQKSAFPIEIAEKPYPPLIRYTGASCR